MTSNSFIQDQLSCFNLDGINLLKRTELLNPLVQKLLIENEILNIKYDEEVILNLKKNIFKRNGFKSQDEFEQWLKQSNHTEESFFKVTIGNLKMNKYVLDNFGHMTESHFLKNQDKLDTVVYSLIRTKDIYLANELYQRIKEGEDDFGDLASQYSTGPEKNTKGIVGPVSVATGHPLIKDLIRSSTVGEIEKPRNLDSMMIIFRLESLQKATLDETTKLSLAKELFMLWVNEQSKLIVDSLELK